MNEKCKKIKISKFNWIKAQMDFMKVYKNSKLNLDSQNIHQISVSISINTKKINPWQKMAVQ